MDSLPLAARASTPEMNRQERVILTVYVAMAMLIAAFLVSVGVASWLS
jgi:hypothetical protein